MVVGDGVGAVDTTLTNYMSEVPGDPLSGTSGYEYRYDFNGTCPLNPGTEAWIFALTMEDASKGNWTKVCDSSSSYDESYIIILGPGNS